MARLTPQAIVLKYEFLKQERENLDAQLSLIERFVMPGRGRFYQEGAESEAGTDWNHRDIYDGTQQNAVTILAANVHGNLTSDAMVWFKFAFQEADLNENKEAAEWLEQCSADCLRSLQESNFSLEAVEFYTDSVGFGTSFMTHDEDEGEPLAWNGHLFASQMMRQCYFEEGFDGRPIGFYIKRTYTPRQLADKFGTAALPERIRVKLDEPGKASDSTEDLIRVIYLDLDRKDADVSKPMSVEKRPYVGRYVLCEGQEFIGEEQGFYEFPVYVLRWMRTAGSKYGHSPSMIALGDILTLQEMVQMVRTSTEKTVDPPMKSTRRGIIGDLELAGGGLTYVRDMDGLAPLLPPGAYRIDGGWKDIADLRARIDRMYYIDQLQLKESPQMTATEVRVRYELMQRLLGPTLGRIKTDFLDPLVKRTFWMMYRKGALRKMPDVVRQKRGNLKIEYIGPLARAQRLGEVDAIQRWLAIGAELAQLPPASQIADLPDYDEAYRHMGMVLGVPEKVIRGTAEIKKIRDARSKQMQEDRAVGQTQAAAGVVKDLTQAKAMGSRGQ